MKIGILTKAVEASFREEMAGIRENMNLSNMETLMGATSNLNLVQIPEEDAIKWKETLKMEILLWGNYDIDISKITTTYIKKNDNFKKIVSDNNGNVKDIYYIEENGNTSRKYIYNKKTDIIYKINQTTVAGHKVHSIEELDYLKNGGIRENNAESNNYTKISYEAKKVTLNEESYYEPDLNNLAKESTSLIFYKLDGENVTEEMKEITAKEWLEGGRKNIITDENGTYVLYDYSKKIWANIKIVSENLETNWVWIPRYAYNEETATQADTRIIFADVNNKKMDGTELPSGFAVAGSFKNNEKKGIWASKYEPTPTIVTEEEYINASNIDVSGFDTQNTHMVFYKLENGQVKEETKTLTIQEWEKQGRPTEINSSGTTYKLYDYENNIWANIKVVKNNLETWWVWIPRYAYNEFGTTTQTDVIFVDTNNKPLDGSDLPLGYVIPGSFKENQKQGIWVSKYEPTPTIVTEKESINASNIDVSGFDTQNTHMVFYKLENGQIKEETKTLTIQEWEAQGRPIEINSSGTTYKLYDYENNIWANIKVVKNNLETWWVWIPRYAYNEFGTTTQTDVIFVDTNNKPLDGSELPMGYAVPGSFKENKKQGMWMSKYEPSPIEK